MFYLGTKPSKLTTVELSVGGIATMILLEIVVLICCAIVKCKPNKCQEFKHRNPAEIERATRKCYSLGKPPQVQWM